MAQQQNVGAPGPLPGRYVSQAFEEKWSRSEFAQGARSGGLRSALEAVLLSRVVGGVIRQRGR